MHDTIYKIRMNIYTNIVWTSRTHAKSYMFHIYSAMLNHTPGKINKPSGWAEGPQARARPQKIERGPVPGAHGAPWAHGALGAHGVLWSLRAVWALCAPWAHGAPWAPWAPGPGSGPRDNGPGPGLASFSTAGRINN